MYGSSSVLRIRFAVLAASRRLVKGRIGHNPPVAVPGSSTGFELYETRRSGVLMTDLDVETLAAASVDVDRVHSSPCPRLDAERRDVFGDRDQIKLSLRSAHL
jgi:hypothetical protein